MTKKADDEVSRERASLDSAWSPFGGQMTPENGPTAAAPFPQTGFVRISQIVSPAGPLPVSRSTVWAWVKAGRFPRPYKLSARVSAWRVEDVHRAIADLARNDAPHE